MTDEELREMLDSIDQDDEIEVTSWEADFIESVLYKFPGVPLSKKQQDVAQRIVEKYY